MAAKPKTTDVALKEPPAQVPAVQTERKGPAIAEGFENFPTGFEGMTFSDYVIPYYTILQGLSPQMETVEGARLGHIINTGTDELMGTSMNFVGCRVLHSFMEWLPNRGGLVGSYPVGSPAIAKMRAKNAGDEFAPLISEAGNQVNETYYLDGVVCDEEFMPSGLGRMAFAVTKIKRFRNFLTFGSNRLTQDGLTLSSLAYTWSTFKDKNKKGEFFNWKFALIKPSIEESRVRPGTPLYDAVADVLSNLDKLKVDETKDDTGQATNNEGPNGRM